MPTSRKSKSTTQKADHDVTPQFARQPIQLPRALIDKIHISCNEKVNKKYLNSTGRCIPGKTGKSPHYMQTTSWDRRDLGYVRWHYGKRNQKTQTWESLLEINPAKYSSFADFIFDLNKILVSPLLSYKITRLDFALDLDPARYPFDAVWKALTKRNCKDFVITKEDDILEDFALGKHPNRVHVYTKVDKNTREAICTRIEVQLSQKYCPVLELDELETYAKTGNPFSDAKLEFYDVDRNAIDIQAGDLLTTKELKGLIKNKKELNDLQRACHASSLYDHLGYFRTSWILNASNNFSRDFARFFKPHRILSSSYLDQIFNDGIGDYFDPHPKKVTSNL